VIFKPDYEYLEQRIVSTKGKDKNIIQHAKDVVMEHKHVLDYITTKFIADFGDRLDVTSNRNKVYLRFIKAKSEEYTACTRMLRLIDYYESLDV
jgi:hypothetical protein